MLRASSRLCWPGAVAGVAGLPLSLRREERAPLGHGRTPGPFGAWERGRSFWLLTKKRRRSFGPINCPRRAKSARMLP